MLVGGVRAALDRAPAGNRMSIVGHFSTWGVHSRNPASTIATILHVKGRSGAVSYTHLTLPTIYSV